MAPLPYAFVYFMRPIGCDGPVKIGSARSPADRLKTYMSWSPSPLEIAATIGGPRVLERRFHAAFAAHHSHHEWFFAAPEISAAIAAIKAGAFDVSSLPPPKSLARTSDGWSAQKRTGIALKAQASRAMYEGLPFPPEVRRAYDTIAGLVGAEWEVAAEILRAHARLPRPARAA